MTGGHRTAVGARVGAMGAVQLPFTKIPTIDIAALVESDAAGRFAVAAEIGRACEEVGFFYIRNHGVPHPLIDRVYARSAQFHHSPAHWREKVHVQFITAERPAGYSRIIAGEHLACFSIQDTKHLRKRVLSGELEIDFPIHGENPFKRRAGNEFQG